MSDETKTRLKNLLKELFQFGNEDLDFGIYKIMNYRRDEIQKFIDKELIEGVGKHLELLSEGERQNLRSRLESLKEKDAVQKYSEAVGGRDENEIKVYEKLRDVKEFLKIKNELDSIKVSTDREREIYNHLINFFSRYYDKGDFISKGRSTRTGRERYAVPYSGEEVLLHWANKDQYYVKTTENFKKYTFRVNELTVNFRIVKVGGESGVTKGKNRYFLLSRPPFGLEDSELNVYLEYRELTEGENRKFGKKAQENINEYIVGKLKKKLKRGVGRALFGEENGKTVLGKHLFRYTHKNTSDYFIHKNLEEFLERELEFYIKNEVLGLKEIGELEKITKTEYEQLRGCFLGAKVVLNIGREIIRFLAQLENFQRKLWEKKKFVIGTHYVITLDKVKEHAGEEFLKRKVVPEILKNKKQLREWKKLFGVTIRKKGDLIAGNGRGGKEWKHLPIDTKHFDEEFKWRMIAALSERSKDLDEILDGVLIKSENWQALNFLLEKYRGKVKCIYIDPPYNSPSTEIIYKNNYKHSSWISLMYDRLQISRNFLQDDGSVAVAIDDHEVSNLKELMRLLFSGELETIVVRSNPAGRSTPKGFSLQHEYVVFSWNNRSGNVAGRLEHLKKQAQRYKETDNIGSFEWVNFRKHGGLRKESPRMCYPIFVSKTRRSWRISKMRWSDERNEWVLLQEPSKNEVVLWPIDGQGQTRRWKWSIDRLLSNKDKVKIDTDRHGDIGIYIKSYMPSAGRTPPTWWDRKEYSATDWGTRTLKDLFGTFGLFDYPKAVDLVKDCLKVGSIGRTDYVVDFFAGSGTTAHAVMKLNKGDGGQRKFILVEIAEYFDTMIIPRIKKVAYSFNWKDGKPQNADGIGVFFKYQYLEQYEDTLENIPPSLEKNKQTSRALTSEFKDYFVEYALDREARDSQTFLNIDGVRDPFNYKLRIIESDQSKVVNVDLMETFNYLLGIHVRGAKRLEIGGRKYVFVSGEVRKRKVVVVWRPLKKIDYAKDKEIIEDTTREFAPDEIYVNGDCAIREGFKQIEGEFKRLLLEGVE